MSGCFVSVIVAEEGQQAGFVLETMIREGLWVLFSQGCNRDLSRSPKVLVVLVLFTGTWCSGLMYSVMIIDSGYI